MDRLDAFIGQVTPQETEQFYEHLKKKVVALEWRTQEAMRFPGSSQSELSLLSAIYSLQSDIRSVANLNNSDRRFEYLNMHAVFLALRWGRHRNNKRLDALRRSIGVS